MQPRNAIRPDEIKIPRELQAFYRSLQTAVNLSAWLRGYIDGGKLELDISKWNLGNGVLQCVCGCSNQPHAGGVDSCEALG